ncbi:hypothetical protein BGZ68_001519 [Mortierella alpina]|nr:hypothetical protein BGZ68_001519 [Mortierella alpina]
MFTRPDEDERNRGGIGDLIDKSFAENSVDSEDESSTKSDSSDGQGQSYRIRKNKNPIAGSNRKCEASLSKGDVKRSMLSTFKRQRNESYSGSSSSDSETDSSSRGSETNSISSGGGSETRRNSSDSDNRGVTPVLGLNSSGNAKRKRAPTDGLQDHSFDDLECRLLTREEFYHAMACKQRKPPKRARSRE